MPSVCDALNAAGGSVSNQSVNQSVRIACTIIWTIRSTLHQVVTRHDATISTDTRTQTHTLPLVCQ